MTNRLRIGHTRHHTRTPRKSAHHMPLLADPTQAPSTPLAPHSIDCSRRKIRFVLSKCPFARRPFVISLADVVCCARTLFLKCWFFFVHFVFFLTTSLRHSARFHYSVLPIDSVLLVFNYKICYAL